MRKIGWVFVALGMVPALCRADADITLAGVYTADVEKTCTSDTTITLDNATFDECKLKLACTDESKSITFTINLPEGTASTFTGVKKKACIKATKLCNIVFTGAGALELLHEKNLSDDEGVLVCNDLTVVGGDIKVTYDSDKINTACIYLKGNYLQTGGKLKVDLHKKNCTNEFAGVQFETKGSTFRLKGGKFNAEIAGTKSRAIDLKKSCTATFDDGEVTAEFEGPDGRFVSGGTVVFNGGSYTFTTNVTAKMTAAYAPTGLRGVRADHSITINGGSFEVDLPLAGSEGFEVPDPEDATITDTFIKVTGGDLDLVTGNDGMNAFSDITVTGGRIRGRSIFDDVLDANRNMYISGGIVRAFATATDTHGLDVNTGYALTITGGNIVATDGPEAKLTTVTTKLPAVTSYRKGLAAATYSGKTLVFTATTNGVTETSKVGLPEFTAGTTLNLLVSAPGLVGTPVAQTAAQAYADASTSTPLVFERKATVADHTVTTKEGDTITIPAYYDLTPAEGKTKTVTLALGESARPAVTSAVCGAAGLQVGVQTTLAGLTYFLKQAASPAPAAWIEVSGSAVAGNGAAQTLTAPRNGSAQFYRVGVRD